MKKLLVVGNDKIGHALIAQIEGYVPIQIVLDKSSNARRTWRLYRRGSLSPWLLFNMAFAEFVRTDNRISTTDCVKNNDDLLHFIRGNAIDQIYLFRSGLIVNKEVLDSGVIVLNTHCARISNYGGLGAIARALQDGAYEQYATIHRVTESIDNGEIIATESYKLDPTLSYRKNEDIAYAAGIRLLLNQLK